MKNEEDILMKKKQLIDGLEMLTRVFDLFCFFFNCEK